MRKTLYLATAITLFAAVTFQVPALNAKVNGGGKKGPQGHPRGAITAPAGDPQMYVCGFSPCTSPPGGDPNFVTSGAITVGFAGSHTQTSDTIIILGVPMGGGVPTISFGGGSYTSGSCVLGVCSAGTTATFTAASSGSAFDQLGNIGKNGGSESFTNWTTSPFPGGASNPDSSVTSFTLYEFDLGSGSVLTTGNQLTFSINNSTNGTFVLAYACGGDQSVATCGTTKGSGGNVFQTVFTNTGFTSDHITTPEPGSLVLLGIGLLGLAALVSKRKKQAALLV